MSEKIIGKIRAAPRLKGKIKKEISLQGKLKYSSYVINDAEIYEGEHIITPKPFQQQELETKDKILKENIKVKEIPYFETSNIYGNTVYIGSEV